MVTNKQIRRLLMCKNVMPLYKAADKANISETTARKYLKAGKYPSDMKTNHNWITRENPFQEVWSQIKEMLVLNPGLEGKTIFEWLKQKYPSQFMDGQLRSLQRKIRKWKAIEGPDKEIFFPQIHKPGVMSQSDFTNMNKIGITINGELFKHLIYHFVLTYSNWETGSICYSESFESLSEGLQEALWELGSVPFNHQTDCLTAAVNNSGDKKTFTKNYERILRHYKLEGSRINAGKPNENGDIEQSNNRFKKAVRQSLMLRCSSDFDSIESYEIFLKDIFKQLNNGRIKRLNSEVEIMHNLPSVKLSSSIPIEVKVLQDSTVNIKTNIYSVHSRLIGHKVKVKVFSNKIEIYYDNHKIHDYPRLIGTSKTLINYRHMIDSLIRKPGAFENYKHKNSLFPSSRFRVTYDILKKNHTVKIANKIYINILYLAAKGNESYIDKILSILIERNNDIDIDINIIKTMLKKSQAIPSIEDSVTIDKVNLCEYDNLVMEVS